MPMHFSPNGALFGTAGRFRDSLGAFHAIFPTDSSVDFKKWTLFATYRLLQVCTVTWPTTSGKLGDYDALELSC